MGLISKQAYSNTLNIILGIAAGAVNTIIVLPHAFNESPEDWGLIKTLIAYGVIAAQVFGFGTYNIIIREYTKQKDELSRKAILGFSLLLGLFGLSILILISYFFKGPISLIVDREITNLIYLHLLSYLILAGVFIFTQTFTGFIVLNHKTPVIQFINEIFLKSTYLILSVVYWINPFSFELYLNIYVSTYVISLVVFVLYAIQLGFTFNLKLKLIKIKELIVYGLYTILDKGAAIIVSNLDIIMIGLLIGLKDVAYYALAFFMGAVIIIPQRALLAPVYPHTSKFLHDKKLGELHALYKQTSINQIIAGGVIFILIWTNIESIYALIPEKFSGGVWVVFFIGISKLFMLSTGISNPIIVFSKYFKVNLIFNSFLILLTIITNYYLILKYGINGAAAATAITFLTYNILKVVYIQYRFKMQPFTKETVKSLVVLLVVGVIGSYIEIFIQLPLISIVIKSIIISILLVIGFYGLKVKAEILDVPINMLKKNRN